MFGGLLEAPVSLPKQQKTNFLEWCSLYSLVVEGYYTTEAIFYLLHQVTGEREIELQFPVMMCLLVAVGNREWGAGAVLYGLKTKKEKT